MPGPTSLIELRDVVVRIDGTTVLGPVSLSILPGERSALLGPNGGGKTTLLAIVGARRQPSSGTARVLGLTFGRGDVRSLHADIGHTSHALSEMFPPHLRVIDVVLTDTPRPNPDAGCGRAFVTRRLRLMYC